METEKIREQLKDYIDNATDERIPNKFEFAKKLGYKSLKAFQRDMAKIGDEGRDILEEVDNEIYIYLINYLARSKRTNDVLVRKHLLSIAGLQEKTSLDVGVKPLAEGIANIDFALITRVEQLSKKEEPLKIEE